MKNEQPGTSAVAETAADGCIDVPGLGLRYLVPVCQETRNGGKMIRFRLSNFPPRKPKSDGVETETGRRHGYKQGHVYTAADIRDAYEAGARDCRENGGDPTDHLIERASDAYVKLVHPLEPVSA